MTTVFIAFYESYHTNVVMDHDTRKEFSTLKSRGDIVTNWASFSTKRTQGEGNAAKKQIICVYFERGKESGGHKKGILTSC